jgi:hypothetical protein
LAARVDSVRSLADFLTAERVLGGAVALILHVGVVLLLASSIVFRIPDERPREPHIVALAPQLLPPPPPDVERIGLEDVITVRPRFRPRVTATPARQRRHGDPALAVWSYLCNRDLALSEAVRRDCPPFDFGELGLGLFDPLNRTGDVGALMGPDTTTMSLDEIGRKKGWFKPKHPWPGEGARAKGNDLGLPGHDPFEFLPKERSPIWGGKR